MKAVITTGGRIEGAYAAEAGTSIKALAEVRGATMLRRTIDALRECGVSRIAVIAEPPVREALDGRADAIIDGAETGAQNVLRALRAWPEDGEPLLYLTSDMPYLNGAALRDFIDRAPANAVAMPLTRHETFCNRFPDAPPFGITLAGTRVINGGVFHVPSGAVERVATAATVFFDARKAPWRMASLAGPALLARFAIGRLSIEHVEKRARTVLGVPVAAVHDAAPELAYDADTIDEYRYARTHW